MSRCKNCRIDVESAGTKPKMFCSDACRMKWKRTNPPASKRTNDQTNIANEHLTGQKGDKVNKSPQIQAQTGPVTSQKPRLERNTPAYKKLDEPAETRTYYVKTEGKVYNRQAVTFKGDQYESRPEPLSPTDQPHEGGRGKYTRADGSTYQIDATGHSHDIPTIPTTQPASLEDYLADQENQTGYYAIRTNADSLNWSTPMSAMELQQAGYKANRVSIVGDWDYKEAEEGQGSQESSPDGSG